MLRVCACALLMLLGVACQKRTVEAAEQKSNGAEYFADYERARDLLKSGKASEAAALYEKLTQQYPDDAEVWLSLGRARAQAKRQADAAEAFARGSDHSEYPGSQAYRVARNYALAGNKAKAIEWLERSLAIPLENRPDIAGDDAFAAFKDDDKFRKVAGLAPQGSYTRDQRWNYDLDFLVAEVRRMHYAVRMHGLPAGFENDVARLRARISKLSDAEMIPEVQKLLALLGDGHTGVQDYSSPQIPVAFYDFADGVFVTDAPEECNCVGDRVVEIGGVGIRIAIEKIAPFLSVDNAMGVRQRAPLYLRMPVYLRAAGIAAEDNQVMMTSEGTSGRRQYAAKAGDGQFIGMGLTPSKLTSAGPAPRYMQHRGDDYTFDILPDGATVYFQFNQVLDEQSESIEQFAPKLRAALMPARVRNLIVDLRHNTGGNLNLFTPLLNTIIAFDTTRNAGIYVLTSRQTFSAAQVFLNELDHYTSAIVAGEPSGSKPNFVGESAQTRLPFSGMEMTISTRYHQTDDQDQRTWIAPKIPVALTSADYFANRDPVMEAVLEVIRKRSLRQ